jgi:hypothetical protein
MNARRRFVPLDVQPVKSEPEVIVIYDSDDEDHVEDITDDEDDEFYSLFLQRRKEEFENLMKNDELFRKQMLAPIEIIKRSPALTSMVHVIVVKKQVPQQNPIPVIPEKIQEDLFKQAEEKRRKERQHIKRKKANKRRHQQKIWQRKVWFDRFKKAPFYI